VSLPAIVAIVALWVAVTAHAIIPDRGGRWAVLDGLAAEGIAIALFGVAGFCHSHYFWLLSPKLHGVAQLGQWLGVVCIAGGVLVAAWLQLRPF